MGFFITIEGCEGSGKTTSIAFVEHFLKKCHVDFIKTREPGGTVLSEKIRDILLHSDDAEPIDPTAELLMIFAARKQHLQQVIIPALKQGKVVLCDRFTDSTWAYQGGGRNMSFDIIHKLEMMVQKGLEPDLTVLFDIPVEIGLARAQKRSAPDRFEREKVDFFERVRSVYLSKAKASRFHVIDASEPIEKVNIKIENLLTEIMKQNRIISHVS